jgi:hypothetical protein
MVNAITKKNVTVFDMPGVSAYGTAGAFSRKVLVHIQCVAAATTDYYFADADIPGTVKSVDAVLYQSAGSADTLIDWKDMSGSALTTIAGRTVTFGGYTASSSQWQVGVLCSMES